MLDRQVGGVIKARTGQANLGEGVCSIFSPVLEWIRFEAQITQRIEWMRECAWCA